MADHERPGRRNRDLTRGAWRSGQGCEASSGTSWPGRGIDGSFESAGRVGSLLVWVSGGDGDRCHFPPEDRAVSRHYDLTGLDDFNALLDELEALLAGASWASDANTRWSLP